MNNLYQIVLSLTRAGLGNGGEWSFGDAVIDWSKVIRLAAAQGVLAIAWDGLQKMVDSGKIPPQQQPPLDIKLRWIANVDSIEKGYSKQKAAIRRLATFYTENGFKMMLMKGYGLSLCYPTPEHRPCGDIDIWLYGRQQEADQLLRAKHNVVINEDKHHHTTFNVSGIIVENHCHFLNIHTHKSNIDFEKELCRLVDSEEGQQYNKDSISFIIPPANFNALFLLKHMAGHFVTSETGLRHICDWAVFAKRYGTSVNWETINAIAHRFNLDRFLAIINKICIDCLGIDAKYFNGITSNETNLTNRVLSEILSPEFNKSQPSRGLIKLIRFRFQRWWSKRWKHKLVYNDSLINIFFRRIWGYLRKPKSIWN